MLIFFYFYYLLPVPVIDALPLFEAYGTVTSAVLAELTKSQNNL